MGLGDLLLDLGIVWLAAKLAGEGIFCKLRAALSERVGLAAIIGAFAAGLVLAKTEPGAQGLVFAGMGLSRGVIDQAVYAALVSMVMAAAFITPPWLKTLYRRP